MQNDLVSAIYDDTPTNGTAVILKYNLVIGSIQIRQLKVRPNSCSLRLYEEELPECYAPTWTHSIQDKSSFGPNNTSAAIAL
jgi:hypothetical protein